MTVGLADRLPQLLHADPDVGDDGHVRGDHGAPGRGVRRAHRGGARHRARRWPPPSRRSPTSAPPASLELRDVGFHYPGAERAGAARRLAHVAAPARRRPIIGSTGAGKTTLRQPGRPPLRRDRGRGARRRRRRPRPRPRGPVEPHRPRARRSRTCSPAPWPATCATASPTPPTTSCGRRSRSPRPPTSCAAMPGGLDAPDRPGRHQRVGRPAPAPRHRPGARAQARDLPVRRLVLGARPRHRRPAARRARARTPRDATVLDRRPAGVDDRRRRPDPRARGRARPSASAPTTSCSAPARPTPRSSRRRSARRRRHDRATHAAVRAEHGRGDGRRRAAGAGADAAGPPRAAGRPSAWRRHAGREGPRLPQLVAPPAVAGCAATALRRRGRSWSWPSVGVALTVVGPEDPRPRHRHRRSAGLPGPTGIDFGDLHRVLLVALGAVRSASSVLTYAAARYLLAGIVQRTMHRLRADVEDKLNRLPLSLRRPPAARRPAQPGHQRHRQRRPEPAADAEPDADAAAHARRRRRR